MDLLDFSDIIRRPDQRDEPPGIVDNDFVTLETFVYKLIAHDKVHGPAWQYLVKGFGNLILEKYMIAFRSLPEEEKKKYRDMTLKDYIPKCRRCGDRRAFKDPRGGQTLCNHGRLGR